MMINVDRRIGRKNRKKVFAHTPCVATVEHHDEARLEGDGRRFADQFAGQRDPAQVVGDAGRVVEDEALAEGPDQIAHRARGSDGVPIRAAVCHNHNIIKLLDKRRHFLGGLDDVGRLQVLLVHCQSPLMNSRSL